MAHHATLGPADAALLEMLTAPAPGTKTNANLNGKTKAKLPRRDAALDPLMIAAALASGPHITRNHAVHDFNPGEPLPTNVKSPMAYVSRQAPRRQRLGTIQAPVAEQNHNKENTDTPPSPVTKKRRASVIAAPAPKSADTPGPGPGPVTVKCMARTRIPTPHGPAFLHLYHNSRDAKEHLALVVDAAQYADDSSTAPPIRSASLDAVWPEETPMDRIVRGAYVGRLGPENAVPSVPGTGHNAPGSPALVRIHSECFTGETVGSQRCDCGEQLDEALRLISLAGRGAVVYLRQEGRGIGLLSKLRAYNLQDLGHDTVAANLLLGHGADERAYDVAGAILGDLGLGAVRLLTNNPDKVEALSKEGVGVVERVPMVPRSWRMQAGTDAGMETETGAAGWLPGDTAPAPGATLVGGHAVHGPDLDKYLRTKVLRMGHMLPLALAGLE
ncbi:Cyclohydrolase [Mycena indigotica]|uniref:GTP cyclohydrolase II n=1 Tax=Mycena indigotica TaxID=2126181 RepID=A0A8H6W3V2_9AGAR|nr:Cyclohydrolase [Mycena indigotica]KAF7301936.1 Cyclohydrolase [Mycena indigotica]